MHEKYLRMFFTDNFKKFWKKNKNSKNFDKDLRFITEKFINSNSYNFVSNQWQKLNINDYKTIQKYGLTKYGSKISTHYFTFGEYLDEHLENLVSQKFNQKKIKLNSNIFKKQKEFNYKYSLNYNILCLLLFERLKKSKVFSKLKLLKDNTFLDSEYPFIKINKYNITTDKIVSLFDYEYINEFKSLKRKSKILEIGAGAGRVAECLLTVNKKLKYTICDIPPSIYISYKRLKKSFPQKKIELLIDEKDKERLIKRLIKNDISFILPHQLDLIKKFYFDMSLAIDCLHEMDKKTINSYFSSISKNSKYFYFSIWQKTKNWDSKGFLKRTERLDFSKGDYLIPKEWKKIFKKKLVFPSNQIALGYKIK